MVQYNFRLFYNIPADIYYRFFKDIFHSTQDKMDNNKAQSESPTLYTNSIIDIHLPEDPCLPQTILFEWSAIGPICPLATPYLYQLIDKNTPNILICSPLYYGNKIALCLKDASTNDIIEQMEYGPIQLERALLNSAKEWKLEHLIQLELNKSQLQNAVIKVDVHSELKIHIQTKHNHQLSLNLAEGIKCQPDKGILRTYATECNCLGFYVYHEMEGLMEFMKNYKSASHYGHYLKVYFQDRMTRDIFICEVMKKMKCKLGQIDCIFDNIQKKSKISVKLSQVKNERSIIFLGEHLKLSESRLLPPPTKPDEASNSIEKSQDEVPEKIIEDIYNILYTPMSNYSKQEELRNFNFDASQQQKREKKLKSQYIKPISSFQKDDEIAPQKKQLRQNKKGINDSQSTKTIKNDYNHEFPHATFQKNSHSVIYGESKADQLEVGLTDRQKKNKVKSIKNKDDYEQKINELLKRNQQLQKQNNKLKEQNEKLKKSKQQNISTQKIEVSKMFEIKNMVKAMAKRLQILQEGNKKKQRLNFSVRQPLRPQYYPKVARKQQKSSHKTNLIHAKSTNLRVRNSSEEGNFVHKWNLLKRDRIEEKEDINPKYLSPTNNYPRFINKNYQSRPQNTPQSPEVMKRFAQTQTIQSPLQRPQNIQYSHPLTISPPSLNKLSAMKMAYYKN